MTSMTDPGPTPPRGAGRGPSPPLRVLVVEDEAPISHLVAPYLAREGFEVDVSVDGESGVHDWNGEGHVVDVHVANLRRKLDDDPQASPYLRTVRGVGYRMGTGG